MSDITLIVETRVDMGKGASRRLRRQVNKVPAILYGGGEAPQPLMIEHRYLSKALENEAFYSSILNLDIEGKKQLAVIKALQRHPSQPRLLHADFQRITGKEKITMRVPLHFMGEDKAPGLEEGGIFNHIITELEVRCLPKNLPEFIAVDVSKLNLDESVHIADISIPEGVEVIAVDHSAQVVAIHVPRAVIEEEPTPVVAEGEEGAAEGEATPEGGETPTEPKDKKE